MPRRFGGAAGIAPPGERLSDMCGARTCTSSHAAGKNFGSKVRSIEVPGRTKGCPLFATCPPPRPGEGALPKPKDGGTSVAGAIGGGVNGGSVGR